MCMISCKFAEKTNVTKMKVINCAQYTKTKNANSFTFRGMGFKITVLRISDD